MQYSTPPRRFPDGLQITLAVILLLIGSGVWAVVAKMGRARASAEAQQQAEAREARLSATLTRLRSASPMDAFDRYPGDNNSLPLKLRLTTCDVRGLAFSRTEGSDVLSVNVSLTGYKPDHQAPVVYVALYGEDGTLLSQKAIVEFADAELEQGETREVSDNMDYPVTGIPVFVGVNQGPDADRFSHPVPDSSEASTSDLQSSPPLNSSEEDYKQGMEDYKNACLQQGFVAIWPHDGDENTVGILMDDGFLGAWSKADKEIVAKMPAQFFAQIRHQHNRYGPFKVIVRFVPSNDVATATGS